MSFYRNKKILTQYKNKNYTSISIQRKTIIFANSWN